MRDVVKRVEAVDAGDETTKALRSLMQSRIAAIPVVDQGRVVGLLSQLDLARRLQLKDLEATQHPSRSPAPPWNSAEQRVSTHRPWPSPHVS